VVYVLSAAIYRQSDSLRLQSRMEIEGTDDAVAQTSNIILFDQIALYVHCSVS